MFGNILIFNRRKVAQYSALILGKSVVDFTNSDKESTDSTNALLECSNFEKRLQKREDYVDFIGNPHDISIQEVPISSIIRVSGEIYIPEEFDMIYLINEYKSLLLSSMDYKDTDEKELISTVFNNSKIKIPVFCELGSSCDYWMGIGKISHDDLLIDYNSLEDYEGTEVTILARLESRKYQKGKASQVYDIYKDFLGLNRALRKQIKTEDKTFEKIEVEEDYLGLELLAVYS